MLTSNRPVQNVTTDILIRQSTL